MKTALALALGSMFFAMTSFSAETTRIDLKKIQTVETVSLKKVSYDDITDGSSTIFCTFDHESYQKVYKKVNLNFPSDLILKVGIPTLNGVEVSEKNCPETAEVAVSFILISKKDYEAAKDIGYYLGPQ